MRQFLRLLLLLAWTLLLTTVCFAAESPVFRGATPCHFERSKKSVPFREERADLPAAGSLETTGGWLEELWEARVTDEACTFSLILTDCGETVAFQPQRGALDVSYTFASTDWSHYSFWYDEEGQHGGTAYRFDPFGDDAVLRVRCFLVEEDGEMLACQCFEIAGQDGVPLCRGSSVREIAPEEQTFCLRFESFPAAASAGDGVAAAEETRRWTYCSSDGRPLWQVALTGSFSGGICESADGCVTVLDDAWSCDSAVFCPDGPCAVARITLSRRALGIPVAVQRYEFRLCP